MNHCTACRQLKGCWKCLSSHSLPPPGSFSSLLWSKQLDWCLMMVGLSIFCAAHLVWQCPQCLPIIYAWGRRAPVNLSNFCDFPKLWSFLFLNLSSFSAGMIVSPSLRKVSLNLYVTISLGFHIRYPAYEIFTLQFIIIS